MKSPVTRWLFTAALLGLALHVTPLISAEKKSEITIDWGSANELSGAIPVPAPASLDAKYTSEGLLNAFRAVAKRMDVRIRRVAVDTTEYPYLVHGVLDGRCSHREMRGAMEVMPGYAYSGSTTLILSNNQTYFVVNMNPTSEYPSDQRRAIGQRLSTRLKALLTKERGR